MSHVSENLDSRISLRWQQLALFLAPLVAVILALLANVSLQWALLIGVSVPILYSLAKWPQASTLVVVFVLYSNAADIAAEFHGVPFVVSASFFLLLLIPLFFHVLLHRRQILFPKTLQLLVLFVLVQIAGALLSVAPDLALKEAIGSVSEGAALYFLIVNVIRVPSTLRGVTWTLIVAGAAISLAPIYQQITGQYGNNLGGFGQVSDAAFATEIVANHGPVQPRLAGSVGEQNRFAQVMLMLVPLAVFRVWGESNKSLRILAALAAGLISIAVVLTFSRGAAIGFVALVLAMAGMRYIRVQQLGLVVIGMVLILLAFPQYVTRMTKLQGVWDLIDDHGAGGGSADGAIKSRFTEMVAAGLVFLDHPLVGVGPGMFRLHYRDYAEQVGLKVFAKGRAAHSLYPGLAAEAGLLGTIFFTAILFITIRDLIRVRQRCLVTSPEQADIAASFVLVIIAYLTTAMFLHLAYIRFFWLMMALAHVAARVADDRARAASLQPQVSP